MLGVHIDSKLNFNLHIDIVIDTIIIEIEWPRTIKKVFRS